MQNAPIVFASDLLATAPITNPTSAELRVQVTFANGEQKDFSNDERVVFTVSNAALAEVYDKHFVRTPSVATGTSTPRRTVMSRSLPVSAHTLQMSHHK